MEEGRQQYQLPYDACHPLLCVAARPCFLIEERGALLPMSPGQVNRYQ
jgi:hypothetical protein